MATESGTTQDQSDMQQLGIEQKLNRNFSIYTLIGFALLIGNNWVYALIGNGVSLQNGGPAGGIWMLCVVLCGMLAVTLCIAEQTSMHPSSGGPYVWVGIHLPGRWGKCISYVVGWLTFLGWQAGMAGTCFLTGEQIRGLIALISSSYKPAPMHSTLLCISVATFAIIWNTLLAKYLPYGEGLMIIPYMMGFIAFLSVLIVMGPKSDATEVFLEFKDPSGWDNTAVATMVGMIAPILTMGSGDATTHLAEEVKNASQSNPKATIIGFLTNSLGALSMSIVLFLRQGNDYAALIGTPYGQPWIQTLVDATGSEPIAAAMLGLVCVLLLAGCVNQTTTTSRQTFAFARDRGLPFSRVLSYVKNGIPLYAVITSWLFTALLSCIPLFSLTTFNIIVSLSMICLYSAYFTIPICSGWFRLSGGRPPPGKFSLGKAAWPTYLAAICYLLIAIVFLCFPSLPKPSLREMNWASAMFLSTILFSLLHYFFSGRHHFKQSKKHAAGDIPLTSEVGIKRDLKSSGV